MLQMGHYRSFCVAGDMMCFSELCYSLKLQFSVCCVYISSTIHERALINFGGICTTSFWIEDLQRIPK